MTSKTIFKTFVSMSTLLIFGCSFKPLGNSQNEKDNSSSSLITPTLPPTHPGDSSTNLICYPSWCTNAVPINSLKESVDDYVYPDFNEFPNEIQRIHYKAPIGILNLSTVSLNQALSPNFQLGEFMSPTKGPYALFSSKLVSILQNMRDYVGRSIIINSGYRSPGYNSRTPGSASWSRHTYGDAIDFVIPGIPIESLTSICERFGASFSLTYAAHIHCDWRTDEKDNAFYGPEPKGDGSEKIKPDLNIAEVIAQRSQIVYQRDEHNLTVSADLALPEDEIHEGELTYYWTVTGPNRKTETYSKPKLILQPRNGKYVINVTVGGTINLMSEFIW